MKPLLPVGRLDVFCMQGVKDIPCIWRVKPELAELYGLPSDLPDRLVGSRTIIYGDKFPPVALCPRYPRELLLFS